MSETGYISKRMPDFAAAHTLLYHQGGCSNLHGHNYGVVVNISGKIVTDPGHPMYGMVLDFGDLKTIYKEVIHDVLDHAVIFGKQKPLWYEVFSAYVAAQEKDGDITAGEEAVDAYLGKVAHLPIQETTAECLSMWITDTLQKAMDVTFPGIRIESVVVYETINSWAERYG